MRIGIFIDVSNLYYCVGKKFNRKLDYKKYYTYVEQLGDIKQAIAYGAQLKNEARGFIHCLEEVGFTPKYKKPKIFHNDGKVRHKADVDVDIAMDIVRKINSLDLIILGCADSDLAPVVDWSQECGVNVIVLATGIAHELRTAAYSSIEIPESFLETP